MIKFWLITILIFIISTYILAKLTLKSNREEAGERIWRFGYGRSTYWRILTLCSIGITIALLLVFYWVGIPIV
ncbi:hypothetical protein EV144_101105 [Flavobacterium sp. 270]|uniref:hypothetical protein n=1 Tax=Flavobacterium sp. 270 TaxID=2512114 RepID=UPI0010659BB8|nr:hypothetical protein [Flavobacterium sp. 270]TDW51430.1 hypothetical protein EV144_101105 [Flavobacterium sp. 270]